MEFLWIVLQARSGRLGPYSMPGVSCSVLLQPRSVLRDGQTKGEPKGKAKKARAVLERMAARRFGSGRDWVKDWAAPCWWLGFMNPSLLRNECQNSRNRPWKWKSKRPGAASVSCRR